MNHNCLRLFGNGQKRIVAMLLFISVSLFAQQDPMLNQRWGIFDINKIKTKFNNTGLLCDGNQQSVSRARPPAFEYPNGSGISYGTAVAVVLGAPRLQDPGAVGQFPPAEYSAFCDATMDEGSAAYWDEEHFAPYPEVTGVAAGGAAMSHLPESWPMSGWPATYPDSDIPLEVGSEGWPGFGAGGERIADQESFSVVYAWGGTDQLASGNSQNANWLNTQMIIRGMAWTGTLYEDFIVWSYVIRNIGTAPITDLRAAVHADFGNLPIFMPPSPFGDDDRHYYEPQLQLAYCADDNGYEDSPFGGGLAAEELAWSGVMILEMPGADERVATYDAFHFWEQATTANGNGARSDLYFEYNIRNVNDPHDSDGDGIDDDFDGNGVPDVQDGGPNYYLGTGADGLQTLGSSPFVLNPGESDTLIFAVVFGDNQADLISNARRAKTLYDTNWEVVKAPDAPVVESFAGDRKVTLVWDNHAEKDTQFEGYKIYRSADNGKSWGSSSFKDFGGGVHYVPLAQYDLENGVTGNYRTLPEFAWFDLGEDSWVPLRRTVEVDSFEYFSPGDTVNMFIDRDVVNGIKYLYYIAAYDSGNGITGPLENTPATNPLEKNNTVSVVPYGAVSTQNLDGVRVVPNPYIVTNIWEQGRDSQIQFTHLPTAATIRIFNSAGELVQTIEHRAEQSLAPGVAIWDLKNYNKQLVAPGLYFYHISSVVGETRGKFVIVI
ncbi:MAG: T9SS type A sorting domain-containing protein [Calditrichia bacterium]